MSDDKKNNININGNIQGGIVGIGGSQTFHGNVTLNMGDLSASVGATPTANETQKAELEKLLAKLQEALNNVPEENKEAAEKVATRTKKLVEEASQVTPDHEEIESKVNLLKKAAENIQGALPKVFEIATSVVAFYVRLHGLRL
jgi:hypothetical protein